MLTAFTYYDPEEEGRIQQGMKDSRFFSQEQEIVKNFAEKHHGVWRHICPSCGGEEVWPIFERLGVKYEHCKTCGSIFAAVRNEEVTEYFAQPVLRDLRLSEDYQTNASKSRSRRWEEVLGWLSFRAFRYLGCNEDLHILDYGNRWQGFVAKVKESSLCGIYSSRDSLHAEIDKDADFDAKAKLADIVLAMNYLERYTEPEQFFLSVRKALKQWGIFAFSIKAGNGFDILKLQGNNPSLLPFEHNFLPSREGIECLLRRTGFELLEYTTPGTFDLNYVKNKMSELSDKDYFIRYFLEHATSGAQAEFQRFLQRSGMSSYAQLIARKKVED